MVADHFAIYKTWISLIWNQQAQIHRVRNPTTRPPASKSQLN